MNLSNLIYNNNPPRELARFHGLMRWASIYGVALLSDTRKTGVTMTPCNEFLEEMFISFGSSVTFISNPVHSSENRLLIVYANILALSIKTQTQLEKFKKARYGPLIVCQTEHSGVRLGATEIYFKILNSADQVWDFGFHPFPGTRSLFFPHMFWGSKYISEYSGGHTNTAIIAGIADRGRTDLLHKISNAGIRAYMISGLTPEKTVSVFKNNVSVAPMFPRQAGNFEFHRFGCLISAGTPIVSAECEGPIMECLSQAVKFVKKERLADCVISLSKNPEQCIQQSNAGRKWLNEQKLTSLIKQVLELINSNMPGFICFSNEDYDMAVIKNSKHFKKHIPLVKNTDNSIIKSIIPPVTHHDRETTTPPPVIPPDPIAVTAYQITSLGSTLPTISPIVSDPDPKTDPDPTPDGVVSPGGVFDPTVFTPNISILNVTTPTSDPDPKIDPDPKVDPDPDPKVDSESPISTLVDATASSPNDIQVTSHDQSNDHSHDPQPEGEIQPEGVIQPEGAIQPPPEDEISTQNKVITKVLDHFMRNHNTLKKKTVTKTKLYETEKLKKQKILVNNAISTLISKPSSKERLSVSNKRRYIH